MTDTKNTAPADAPAVVSVLQRILADHAVPFCAEDLNAEWNALHGTDCEKLAGVLARYGLEPVRERLTKDTFSQDAQPVLVVFGEREDVAFVQDVKVGTAVLRGLESGASHSKPLRHLTKRGNLNRLSFAPLEQSEDASERMTRLQDLNPLRNIGAPRLGFILFSAFAANVLSLASSIFIMVVYDRVIPNKAVESLYALAIGAGLAILFERILRSASARLVSNATRRADKVLVGEMFDQFVEAGDQSERRSVGELSMLMRDYEIYRDFMSTKMILTFVDIPFVAIFIAVIAGTSGQLYLVPLTILPLTLLSVLSLQRLVSRSARDLSAVNQTRQSYLVEVLSGLQSLRVSGAHGIMKKRFLGQTELQTAATERSQRYNSWIGSVVSTFQQVAQVVVVVFGFHLFVAQEITMGGIIAAVILTGRIMGPIARLGAAMGQTNQALVALANLKEFLGLERRQGGAKTSTVPASKEYPAIELSNVTYRNQGADDTVLANLDLRINAGEKVAVVGRTGAGKSTLLHLMNGLRTPETGAVRVSGQSVTSIQRKNLHKKIGTVFQQPWVMSGTLFENLSLNDPTIDETQARSALLRAGFAMGEKADLSAQIQNQGANLSGGEKQAIALARVFAADPDIYLLDEPSAAMDTVLEARLAKQMEASLAEKTVVMVTHRSRLLELCDRVIVIEQGRVTSDLTMDEYKAASKANKKGRARFVTTSDLAKGNVFRGVPSTRGQAES